MPRPLPAWASGARAAASRVVDPRPFEGANRLYRPPPSLNMGALTPAHGRRDRGTTMTVGLRTLIAAAASAAFLLSACGGPKPLCGDDPGQTPCDTPVCGNGEVEDGEECDDGNTDS